MENKCNEHHLIANVIFLFIPFIGFAQAPNIEWQNTIGGISSDEITICQTSDGGFIIGGSSQSGPYGDKTAEGYGNQDYWVLKLNSFGIIEWQNSYGGSGTDNLFDLCQTQDGGFILAGSSNSDISGNKSENTIVPFSFDYWVVKLDSSGEIEWQNNIGGSGSDQLYSVDITLDGGYVLGGWSNSPISGDKTESNFLGSEDFWIIKLDSLGNILWQNNIGGASQDWLYSINHTLDNGIILCGKSNSGISGDKLDINFGSEDYWVIKLDSLGLIEWQKTYGGNQLDRPYVIRQMNANSYIVGGMSSSGISGNKTDPSQGDYDYWILELDSIGNIMWQNDIGGNLSDVLIDINQTSDSGFILGGFSRSDTSGDKTDINIGFEDYWVIKLDNVGNILWQRTLGGWSDDYLMSVQQTADLGYILGGWSNSPSSGDKIENNIGDSDFWIVKLFADSCEPAYYYADFDDDGFGNPLDSIPACFAPFGYVANDTDCDDNLYGVNPAAVEICNEFDDNCNGDVDEDFFENVFYADADNDGYGNSLIDSISCHTELLGFVTDSTDCDDANNSVHSTLICFADEDGDGFGNSLISSMFCDILPPAGFVTDSTDCDDSNATIYPTAPELLNAVDDNCNDSIDEGLTFIYDLNAPSLNINPNPNNGLFELKWENLPMATKCIDIFDITGNKIYSHQTYSSDGISVDLQNLPSGIFIIYLTYDQFYFQNKIVIQKP